MHPGTFFYQYSDRHKVELHCGVSGALIGAFVFKEDEHRLELL